MAEITLGNLYEANKQLSQQMDTLTEPEIAAIHNKLNNWFCWHINKYAMLLCHERRDYTVINLESDDFAMIPKATRAVFDCIHNRGELVSCDPADGDAWEIWLRIDGEDFCYYLFNYDAAVIEF